MAAVMVELLPGGAEVLAGMELGGVPLAVVMSQLTGLPTVFVRKHAKAYGTRRLAEGAPVSGRYVVAVEDVVTQGGALTAGCLALRAAGARVDTAICAVDREQGGAQVLDDHGIGLRAALRRDALDSVSP